MPDDSVYFLIAWAFIGITYTPFVVMVTYKMMKVGDYVDAAFMVWLGILVEVITIGPLVFTLLNRS